jgi:hypothetical protein
MFSRSASALAAALAAASVVTACSKGDARPASAARGDSTASSPQGTAAGEVAAPAADGATSQGGRKPNLTGRIPVLEYHVIGGDKNALYTRTIASFKSDLEEAYRLGYRPITMSQMLDKDFRDVPAGMSPVIVVFDDASPSQFSYLGQPGQIDPNSAVGIWLDFAKSHPGWKNRAVFCMLNGGAAGHNFFGDTPKYGGQQKAWRFQKVQWLNQQGFELCGHTLWHARLDKYSDAVVQEQIARKVRSFALPYGIWPKNRQLAWQGSWTDPKSGKTITYHFDDVMEVSGGPTRSPYDPQFNPHSVTRIEAVGDDIRKTLQHLDQSNTRFVAK